MLAVQAQAFIDTVPMGRGYTLLMSVYQHQTSPRRVKYLKLDSLVFPIAIVPQRHAHTLMIWFHLIISSTDGYSGSIHKVRD
jgi:hypothetical protein